MGPIFYIQCVPHLFRISDFFEKSFERSSLYAGLMCVCRVFLSVHCSLVITCWERADLLALMSNMFYCVFVTFQCGVLGQVWCLIVSISDLCLLSYFPYITYT